MTPELRLLVEWEPRWRAFTSSIRPALARTPPAGSSPLLLNWEPRWRGFVGALRPALRRSERPLEGECPAGLFSRHGVGMSLAAHLCLVAVLVWLSSATMRGPELRNQAASKYEVVYYSGDYLPQTEDSSGALAGREGRAGGNEAYDPRQLIHIARGERLIETVADPPTMRLPSTMNPVNLLAIAPAEPVRAAVEPPSSLAKLPPVPLTVVPPAPALEHSRMAMAPQIGMAVVEPAPAAPGRKLAALPVADPEVVPPPIAVPARESTANAKLELPSMRVVEPPPADFARDIRSQAGMGTNITGKDIVPPPPTPGGRQLAAQPRPGLAELSTVAPPPPTVNAGALDRGGANAAALFGKRTEIAPPPAGPSPEAVRRAATGMRARNTEFGNSGFVISLAPGARVGMPDHSPTGALAMSPNGNGKNGAAGSGGGTGTGAGDGTGSATKGSGTGATVAGNGYGANPLARGGTSPNAGPGGSGLGGDNHGGVAGVTIRGGVVTLPAFGAPASGGPNIPASSTEPTGPRVAPDITVVATSRSGGALDTYGVLRGAKVYTIYLDTRRGPAVLEYADPATGKQQFESELIAPQAVNTALPATLAKARFVVACVMDRSGVLKDFHVLDNAGVETSTILTAIHDWRFRPVLRGEKAVEVNAIVGFGMGTR